MTWQHLNSLGVALQLRDRLAINIFIAFLSEDFVVNFSKMKIIYYAYFSLLHITGGD